MSRDTSKMSDNRFFYEELRKLQSELDTEKKKNIKLDEFINILNNEIERGGKEN